MRRARSVHHRPSAESGEATATPRTAPTTAPEEGAPGGGGQKRSRVRDSAPIVAAIGAVFALIMLIGVVAPASAQAKIKIPNPIDIVAGPLTGGVADMAVGAFDAIIKHLFAPMTKLVTVDLIGWLVAIPNFTDGTHVARLETTVTAMGGGLLAAVATVAIARYWLIGYAGSGVRRARGPGAHRHGRSRAGHVAVGLRAGRAPHQPVHQLAAGRRQRRQAVRHHARRGCSGGCERPTAARARGTGARRRRRTASPPIHPSQTATRAHVA